MFRSAVRVCARPVLPLQQASRRFTSASGPQFSWEDPLNTKSLLTEDEIAIAETAERYCQERLQPRVLGRLFAALQRCSSQAYIFE